MEAHCTQSLPDSNNLPKVQLVVVDLSDEDGRHGLVECRSVHVNGGSHRQYKAYDAPDEVVVLQEALEGDRQCGRAAAEHMHTGSSETDTSSRGPLNELRYML